MLNLFFTYPYLLEVQLIRLVLSVSSPLPFIGCINDLPNCLTFTIVLHADGRNIYLSDKNLNGLQFSVKFQLLKVDKWMGLNKL